MTVEAPIAQRLEELVRVAVEEARRGGAVTDGTDPIVEFERPRRREHGDLATNVALRLASGKGSARDVAEALRTRLPASELVSNVEVAGPGFLNFHLSARWLHDVVRLAADEGSPFGRSAASDGETVNLEYVSSNPTGPVSIVSGRHAAIGDALANLLEATGQRVTREFYANDAGRQMHLFAQSLEARYLEQLGREVEFPQDGYRGEYLRELATELIAVFGDSLAALPDEDRTRRFRSLGLERMLAQIQASLERFGTRFDVWSSETTLRAEAWPEVFRSLREKGFIEEREGAMWFKSSLFGDDKDRVIVRSNGEPTYLASDFTYMADKFRRGFDRLIYLLGADHHGTVPRMLGAAEALGYNRSQVELPLVQIVTINKEGQTLKGSKRAGVIELLDDLVEEVGADAVRYTFLTRSNDAPLEFDLDLVRSQAPENPVYYVQYAHARICSIFRTAAQQGYKVDDSDQVSLDRLDAEGDDALMRKLATYEEVVMRAAQTRGPQRITRYVEELASTFSAFYRDCRVLSDDEELTKARLLLCAATRRVIADSLGLLGVGAPERM